MTRPMARRKLLLATLTLFVVLVFLLNASTLIAFPHAVPIAPHDMNELPDDDYSRLVGMEDFEFTMNSSPCNLTGDNRLLILVLSAPRNIDSRNVIRSTWAKQSDSIKLIFLIGGVDREEVQDQIYFEREQYGDVVQGNFMDSYKNLSYKHVMALKWSVYHCPGVEYVLKTDDDVFVNTPYLLKYLSNLTDSDRTMTCRVCSHCRVWRKNSKFRLTKEQFAPDFFPTYCFGFALIYTPRIVFELYKEVQRRDYFWIEDVWISGIVAEKINVTYNDITPLILSFGQMNTFLKDHNNYKPFLYGPIELKADSIKKLWSGIERVNHSLWE